MIGFRLYLIADTSAENVHERLDFIAILAELSHTN